MKTESSRLARAAVLGGIVAAAAAAVHRPVLEAQAASFDDHSFLFGNPTLRELSWDSVGRVFGEVFESPNVKGYYEPLTLVSLMADVSAGGRPDDLRPFHRTSLALHAANTALVVWLLYALFGNVWAAAVCGLVFGVHPLTVEPVAWVWERKTLLSTFFALLSLLAYVKGVGGPGRGVRGQGAGQDRLWYFLSFVAFALALLSKPTSTPLPVLMLILDGWPLRRLGRRAITEKIPFFALAAVSAVVTIISTHRGGAVTVGGESGWAGLPLRIAYLNAFYLWKVVWPWPLSSVYEMPASLASGRMIGAAAFSAALVAGLVLSVRKTRAAAAGWLFFFVAILPTLGILQYSWVEASDKYVYLPGVGLLLVGAWAATAAWDRGAAGRVLVVAVGVVLAAACTTGTRRYLTKWKDSETLYRHMLEVAPGVKKLHNSLGNALVRRGRWDEAAWQFEQALQAPPEETPEAHNNLANILAQQGRYEEAIGHYLQVLAIRPDFPAAYGNLANVLQLQGRYAEAVEQYRGALRQRPEDVTTLGNLAWLLATREFPPEAAGGGPGAVELAEKACELTGQRDANLLDTLAAAYAAAGRFDDAAATAQRAVNRAMESGQWELARMAVQRMKLYQSGQPYREPPATQAAR